MGLAPFFDKTALAAATVLRGFDRGGFAAALESLTVAVTFDDAAVSSAEGRVTLDLATNLLARLFPRIVLAPVGTLAAQYSRSLEAISRDINPNIDLASSQTETTICLCVGQTALAGGQSVVYLGSDGWVARLSPTAPLGSGASGLPFGAAAAACFGVANVFRKAFSDQLPDGALDSDITLSLIDLEVNAAHPANPGLGIVSLGESQLVGAGAIGNAAIWTLVRTPNLSGQLDVIDGEVVELFNVQRYVLTTPADVERKKVDLAERAVGDGGLNLISIVPRFGSWSDFLAQRPTPWNLGRVAVALDSARDRISVQAALPRWIVNAWTQPGDLGVSRHRMIDNCACLACLYLPSGASKNEDQLVADAIRLTDPNERVHVRTLLHTGAPVGGFIERMAAALGVPMEPLAAFADRPIRAFYSEALCGGIVLGLQGGGDATGGTEVPMAFQSALAGVLLAATLVADAAGISLPSETKAGMDLLRPIGRQLRVPVAKHQSGKCICQDPDFRNAYETQHGLAVDDASSSSQSRPGELLVSDFAGSPS